ncbi:MAG: hypothetical protein M1812_007209 [Candelaria pacifica]|nr:MAG: hypothetical protein M1812_007209 [Candelaria pacifica]
MKDPPNWYKEYRSGPTDRLGGRPNWYKEYRSGPTDRLGGAILNRLGPHLLRVNRQIKDEAAPILYQEILFVMTLFVGKRGKVATSGLERFGQFAPLIENIRLDLTVRFEDYPRGDNSVALAFVEDLSYKLNTLKNLRRLEIKPRTTIIVESSGTWWKPRRETRVIPNRPEFYMILKAHMFLFEPLSRVRNIGKVLWSVNKPSVYMEHLSEMMESKMRYPHRAIMQFDAAEYEKREADVVRPTTDQQSIFHFLQLPPELRNRIYQLVLLRSEKPRSYIGIPWKEHLPRKPKYQASNRTGPHLLRVNQQIYREAITILYGESMINAAANSGTLVWKPHFRPPGLWNYGRNLAMIENLCLQFNFSTNCGKGLLQVKAMVRSMRNELEAMVNLRELKLYVRHWGLDEEIQVIRSSNHDRLDDIRAKLVSFMSTESALHRDQEELMNFLRLETEVAILEPLSHVRGIRSVKISGPVTTAYGLYLKQMMEADESVPHRAFRGLTAEGQKE